MLTSSYAAVFGLLFAALSVRTLLLRRRFGVAIGTGGHDALERAARVHANFAEYVPLTLLLIFLLELGSGSSLAVHALCAALLTGRLLHAYGVSRSNEDFRFRVAGMVLTLGALISASARLGIASAALHVG